jgi:hypothetical protein
LVFVLAFVSYIIVCFKEKAKSSQITFGDSVFPCFFLIYKAFSVASRMLFAWKIILAPNFGNIQAKSEDRIFPSLEKLTQSVREASIFNPCFSRILLIAV